MKARSPAKTAVVAALAVLATVASLPLAPVSGAASASLEILPVRLPVANAPGVSVASDGVHVYTFGGYGAAGLDVMRFDPLSSRVERVAELPPPARTGGPAVFAAGAFYLFGGIAPGGIYLDEVLRFDPATNEVRKIASFPTPVYGAAAVATPHGIFVFGGTRADAPSGRLDAIVRFDVLTATSHILPARLPAPAGGLSAVWSGARAYLFGGMDYSASHDRITSFDPVTGAVEVVGRLPTPRGYLGAAWDAVRGVAYVSGECCSRGRTNEILEFAPGSGVTVLPFGLPSPRYVVGAAAACGTTYAFGGTTDSAFFDEVLRIGPPPSCGAPGGVASILGERLGDTETLLTGEIVDARELIRDAIALAREAIEPRVVGLDVRVDEVALDLEGLRDETRASLDGLESVMNGLGTWTLRIKGDVALAREEIQAAAERVVREIDARTPLRAVDVAIVRLGDDATARPVWLVQTTVDGRAIDAGSLVALVDGAPAEWIVTRVSDGLSVITLARPPATDGLAGTGAHALAVTATSGDYAGAAIAAFDGRAAARAVLPDAELPAVPAADREEPAGAPPRP